MPFLAWWVRAATDRVSIVRLRDELVDRSAEVDCGSGLVRVERLEVTTPSEPAHLPVR